MKSVYTDMVQIVVVKNKFAYHYNIKNGSYIGRSEFEPTTKGRMEFIDQLHATGFKRDEEDYQNSLQKPGA